MIKRRIHRPMFEPPYTVFRDDELIPDAKEPPSSGSERRPCSPSSDSSVGKSFTMIGFGGPRLRERVKTEGLVLWSISQAKGYPDEFTRGWSGCDPGQLYFVENAYSPDTRQGNS